MKHYIGITGFKTVDEVQYANKLTRHLPDSHELMIGILTSHNRLQNRTTEGSRTPAAIEIRELVKECGPRIKPVIHYCTTFDNDTKDELTALFNEIDDWCHAVQFNHTWPQQDAIEYLKSKVPSLEVVLQVLPGIMLDEIAMRVNQYKNVSYILNDASQGAGVAPIYSDEVNRMMMISNTAPDKLLVTAGGFDEKNVFDRVTSLRQYFDKFSIDAEGKLFDGDRLDMNKVEKYVLNASKAFS